MAQGPETIGFNLCYDNILRLVFVMFIQTVILLSQIRVNSMAIIRMKSVDIHTQADQSGKVSSGGASTSSVEQVLVIILYLGLITDSELTVSASKLDLYILEVT